MLCDEGKGGSNGATLVVGLLFLVLGVARFAAPLTLHRLVPPAIAIRALVASIVIMPFYLTFITNVGPRRAFVTPHLPGLWTMGWTLAVPAWSLGLGSTWGGLDSGY